MRPPGRRDPPARRVLRTDSERRTERWDRGASRSWPRHAWPSGCWRSSARGWRGQRRQGRGRGGTGAAAASDVSVQHATAPVGASALALAGCRVLGGAVDGRPEMPTAAGRQPARSARGRPGRESRAGRRVSPRAPAACPPAAGSTGRPPGSSTRHCWRLDRPTSLPVAVNASRSGCVALGRG